MFHPFQHLDDPVSRASAGLGLGGGGLIAFAGQAPFETLIGAVVAILVPLGISAINKWIATDANKKAMTIAALEATVKELEAQIEAMKRPDPEPGPDGPRVIGGGGAVPFADPDRRG